MGLHSLYASGIIALQCALLLLLVSLCCLLIAFAHYALLRWRPVSGKCGSTIHSCCLALGMAIMQIARIFQQPTVAIAGQAEEAGDPEEDDATGSDTAAARLRHFHRQLRRIRHGTPLDYLEWRV